MFDRIVETNGKKVSIQITNKGEVILRKPKNYNQKLLDKFIENKRNWIETNRDKILKNNEKHKDVLENKKVLIGGIEKNLILNSKKNIINEDIVYAKTYKSLITMLKKYAISVVQSKILVFAKKIGVTPNQVLIENTKRRWGVCTNKRDIKINFRAVMLNEKCLDYILIHELLHIKEFNHSKKFWDLVKKYVPDYLELKKVLKEYSFLLEMYR